MGIVERAKELKLKITLGEKELLDIIEDNAPRVAKRLYGSGFHPVETRKSEVVAKFSTVRDTLTLTGSIEPDFRIHFLLKPNSKTYRNFLEFVLGELKTIGVEQGAVVSAGSEEKSAVSELTLYLEKKLETIAEDIKASFDNLSEITEIFGSDLALCSSTHERHMHGGASLGVPQKSFVLGGAKRPTKTQFRLIDPRNPRSKVISGFLSLEISNVDSTTSKELTPVELARAVSETLEFIGVPHIQEKLGRVEVAVTFSLAPELVPRTEFWLHWGRYQDPLNAWVDEEVLTREIVDNKDGTYTLIKEIVPERLGHFGVTVFARPERCDLKLWLGEPGAGDGKFKIDTLSATYSEGRKQELRHDLALLKEELRQSLSSFEQFVRTVCDQLKEKRLRNLGKILLELSVEEPSTRGLLSEFYEEAHTRFKSEGGIVRSRLKRVLALLQNIGIGEVVLVAPEGPHAIAGGLAQVVVGLLGSLTKNGIFVTLITPLYEEAQGHKHKSAEELLNSGVQLNGKTVSLERRGEIKIPFGPVNRRGSGELLRFPRLVTAEVYIAEDERSRIIFLRHRRLANQLYANVWSDELLRRALFISRGALEIIRDPSFDVAPHILVTNDWFTGLVPALLKTDPRYASDHRLNSIETVHVIHNCGRDYQGRMLASQFGEDLFPLLGIDGSHYFGISDPENRDFLNMTAAALFHVKKAVLAVSRPYAAQLLSESGGEGLGELFRRRRELVFGISNGIDLNAVRRAYWRLGEGARSALNRPVLLKGNFNDKRFFKRLVQYKQSTKEALQLKYNLADNPSAILISLVGRLTEQKGIELLVGSVSGLKAVKTISSDSSVSGESTLESILKLHPQVQFIIGGPPYKSESAFNELEQEIARLSLRYPGRIRGVFDFIMHQDALEITQGSDLFLMPSRFEPGGITQLEALAAGTLVVARNVGGIAATLKNFDSASGSGTAFLFDDFTSAAFFKAVNRAISTISDRDLHLALIEQAAHAENDWGHRVPKYVALLQYVSGALTREVLFPFLRSRYDELKSIMP